MPTQEKPALFINEASDDVKDILNYKPHWIVRRGNAIFFTVLLLFLVFTSVIKYPDVIKGSLRLVAVNAPKLMVARTETKLQKLLVTNEQEVKQGQVLAFLQSTADHNQVIALQKQLDALEPFIQQGDFSLLASISLTSFNRLGEVQPAYQEFETTLKETMQILHTGFYSHKETALQQDLRYLSDIQDNAKLQQQLIKQDDSLQKVEFNVNQLLAKDKIIAPLELNENKSKMINKSRALAEMDARLINGNMTSLAKRREIMELNKYVDDQKQKFRSALYTLRSRIADWMQLYTLVAQENGKIIFASFLQENQLLGAGQELFYIQPPQSYYFGQMMVSQLGLGKIKKGQQVLIRVASYPSSEFGYLTGKVDYISGVPTSRDSFLLRVQLLNGLHTNYKKTILFRNNLIAEGEILTDNRKLFDRFWGQLHDIMKR